MATTTATITNAPPIRRARLIPNGLVVITTALITWVVSALFFSHAQHSGCNPTVAWGTHFEAAAVSKQLSSSSCKKSKKKSYVNMTGYAGPSTTWQKYPYEFPCVQGETKHMLMTPAYEGILFQRPVKTGSTTLTAIVLRLIDRYAETKPFAMCKYRAMHETSRVLDFGARNPAQSYLLSVVRDPTAKAISRYFHFDVSVGQKTPTDEHFQEIMGRFYNRNSLTFDLTISSGLKQDSFMNPASVNATAVVEDILSAYDFIAVTERMDESLIVWKLLFHLDWYDILYIKARASGTFSNGGSGQRPCVYLVPAFLSPGMEEFFSSKEWKDSNAIDILLYQAVYQSLDNTIKSLGSQQIQRDLETFSKAQKIANDYCRDKVKGFCTAGGALVPASERTCVVYSEGCDFPCLKEFRKQEGLKQILQQTQ